MSMFPWAFFSFPLVFQTKFLCFRFCIKFFLLKDPVQKKKGGESGERPTLFDFRTSFAQRNTDHAEAACCSARLCKHLAVKSSLRLPLSQNDYGLKDCWKSLPLGSRHRFSIEFKRCAIDLQFKSFWWVFDRFSIAFDRFQKILLAFPLTKSYYLKSGSGYRSRDENNNKEINTNGKWQRNQY